MAEHAPSTPASALLRAVPLSLWPESVRDRRRRLAAALRRLEALQAEMIDKLDQLTPDADLEPTLGAPDSSFWRGGGSDQRHWAKIGDGQDGEGEPDADGEPWLGSLTTPCTLTVHREPGGRRATGVTINRDDQMGWVLSGHTDTEEQCEDEGEPEYG